MSEPHDPPAVPERTVVDPYIPEQETLAAGPPPTALRLGRYAIAGRLGAGGMGEVLEVHDDQLGRRVAAKVIRGLPDPRQLEAFTLEARVTGQLEHPSIVPAYELGETPDGQRYLTMKKVDGHDLAEHLVRLRARREASPAPGGALPDGLVECLGIFVKVCEAVAYAHSKGVLHRDLKPANIMVGAFGEVLVMDWGLAKIVGSREEPSGETGAVDASGGATLDGTVKGTPAYMPPEQARGDVAALDERSDVYSLGAILYEMLTLQAPYGRMSIHELLAAVSQGPPPPPSEVVAAAGAPWPVPWELEAAVTQAMASDPDARYPDARSLCRDVEAFLASQPLSAARYTLGQQLRRAIRRHRGRLLACAAVLLAVALVSAHFLHQRRERARADQRRALAEVRTALHGLRGAASLRAELERPAAERARLRGELPRYLAATSSIERALELHPGAPKLRALRAQLGEALGVLAAAVGDFALADHAMGELTRWDQPAARVTRLRAEVERQRTRARDRELARQKRRIEAHLAELARTTDRHRFDDAVYEAITFRDAQTARMLGAVLDPLSARLTRGEALTPAQARLARYCVTVLGRIEEPGSVPPLARWLVAVREPRLIVDAGVALCATRQRRAWEALEAARDRLGFNSELWARIRPHLAKLPTRTTGDPDDPGALAMRAWERQEAGELAAALADLDRALARRPDVASWLYNRAQIHQRLGQLDKALADLERAMAVDPDFALPYLGRALIREAREDIDGALADLDRVLALAPDNVAAWSNRAFLRFEKHRVQEALADFDRAIALDPRRVTTLLGRARARRSAGQLIGALADAERVIELAPRRADGYLERAAAHSKLGKLTQAFRDVEHAVRLAPEQAGPYVILGRLQMSNGQPDRALASFNKALERDPDHLDALTLRAMIRLNRGQPDAALPDLERAIALLPHRADPYFLRGALHQDAGRPDLARADFDRAIARDPRHVQSYYRRGRLHAGQKRLKAAIADYSQALALDPRLVKAYNDRGLAYVATGEPAKALADYTRGIELMPTAAVLFTNRGILHHGQKRFAEAARDYDRALELDPSYEPAYEASYRLSMATPRMNIARGLRATSALLKRHPGSARWLSARGYLHLCAKDHARALADFDAVLRRDPDDWYARCSRGSTLFEMGRREEGLAEIVRGLKHVPAGRRAGVRAELERLRRLAAGSGSGSGSGSE